MKTLERLLLKYQAYLAIVGAILIFGSWILTSTITDVVKKYQSNLEFITNNDEISSGISEIKQQLNNAHKAVLRTRSTAIDPESDVKQFTPAQTHFYKWSKEYEFIDSWFEDWKLLYEEAHRTKTKIETINISGEISDAFGRTFLEVEKLFNEFSSQKEQVARSMASTVIIRDMPDSVANRFSANISSLRDFVRRSTSDEVYISLENQVFNTNYNIKNSIKTKLATYKALSNMFSYFSILFYIIGTALTIYSKVIDVKSAESNASVIVHSE